VDSDQLRVCIYTPSAFGAHARFSHSVLSALSGSDFAVLGILEPPSRELCSTSG